MISDRVLQLLARQMGNLASEKEILELSELLKQYPENHFFVEILQSIKSERSYYELVLTEDELVHESWLMLRNELNDRVINKRVLKIENEVNRKKFSNSLWIRNAAIWTGVIILFTSSFFIWKLAARKPETSTNYKVNQVIVPYGAIKKIILPDSTIVWVNAGSHIHYAADFIQKTRKVYLDGEAYFTVKHDAEHPFIVHAGNITVHALGTEFNVRAYKNETKVEATLISGKIQVSIENKADKKIILVPNEKLTVINEKEKSVSDDSPSVKELSFEVKEVKQIPSISTVKEVAWIQDILAFQNESFKDLAKRMERRYDVHIIFKTRSLEEERLSGIFENETIQKALNLLQMTTQFRYQVHVDSVFLNL